MRFVTLTHNQLQNICEYLQWLSEDKKIYVHHDDKKVFDDALNESKMIYSITLRYPSTQIRDLDISCLVKKYRFDNPMLQEEWFKKAGLI